MIPCCSRPAGQSGTPPRSFDLLMQMSFGKLLKSAFTHTYPKSISTNAGTMVLVTAAAGVVAADGVVAVGVVVVAAVVV